MNIEDIMAEDRDGGIKFKRAFTLYAIHAILGPPRSAYVSRDYLFVAGDLSSVLKRNWAMWALNFLMDGLSAWQNGTERNCKGCILFLEVSNDSLTIRCFAVCSASYLCLCLGFLL